MRQTARAVLINSQGLCFLAVHNHYRPENIGKWGTVGGIMDPSDFDILACLQREISEEFLSAEPRHFQVFEKLGEIEKEGTLYHFFHVTTHLEDLIAAQPEEILQCGFFPIEHLKNLKAAGKLYFGSEDELFSLALERKK